MKNLKAKLNKLLSVFLVLCVVVSMFSGLGLINAETPNPHYNKIADSATLDGWKQFFGSEAPSTENAGGVWTDKSVFADNTHEVFQNLTDAYGNAIKPTVADDSFLVSLSAIASNKSIVGYSHIPTDTVLVLDISGSMGPSDNDAIEDLVLAANAAMTELLKLNSNNRVGIVLYSAEYEEGNPEHYYTLLPIDRYSATDTVNYNNGTPFDTSDDITVGKYLEMGDVYREVTVTQGGRPGRPGSTTTEIRNVGDGIGVADGVTDSNGDDASGEPIWVVGGTFIQGGLQAAADLFKAKRDANDTVIKGEGFQSGTQRKPVMVLMSDGAPTYATTNYKNPSNPTLGTGHNTSESYAFLTQLTAANVKNTISSYYNDSEALFYTLGLGVDQSAVAKSVLDPANSTVAINGYWDNFVAAANNSTVQITNNVSVVKDDSITDIVYANQYFEAETGADLVDAFDKIVSEIIIQSLYRPTLVENNDANMEGYIEFIDDIGDYMKVQEIEGIMIGNKLFTGEKLAENFQVGGGDLGTVENPNKLGDSMVWAVKERLGIESTQEAQELITQAYTHGQLSYNKSGSDVTFSNYIGWYADENGNYLGFWCDKHTYKDIPDNAKYINKSYGMLGEIPGEHIASDLMYVSIQVHTEIVPKDRFGLNDNDSVMAGHAQFIFRIPASLIPVVTYEVELEGTGYDDAKNITMTINDTEPIRLLFEVGLRDDINEYNIEAALGSNSRNANGEYVFYTNQWSEDQFNKEIDPSNSEYISPTDSINTIAYFEPNYENERYYYSEATPIYVKQDSEYVKYSSDTQPTATDGNDYYRQINVFELTGNGNDTVHNKVYERISNTALGRVEKSSTNGGWNIMKETIHRVYDEIETLKITNSTGTLGYSYFPTVEHIEGTHYYADAILGNNGMLTVTPATGISITKTVDASMEGNTDEYTFNVDIGNEATNYSVVRKGDDGMFADVGEKIYLDANGKGTIKLVPGETVLIVGIPAGESYYIDEEIPAGANFEVSESHGTSGVVEQNRLVAATFENAIRQSGNLIIAKHVTHPFASAPESINNHVFKFDAVLSADGSAYPDTTVEAYYSTAPDAKFDLNVVNNKIEGIELKGNQSIIIKVKDGWTATVTEQTNMPDGFTLTNTEVSANTTVTTDTNVEYVFTNTYNPDDVTADITIDASKVLNGRPWNNDEFTFALFRYNKHNAQYDEITRETINTDGDFGLALTDAMKQEVFTEVGEYHYMVRELVPDQTKGITYDSHYRIFTVVVTDTDTDGKLEIAEVEASNAVTVTANGNAYTVDLEPFVNVYKAGGIAEVIIEINKTVDTPDGIDYSAEGFEFGVYDADGTLVSPLYTTDADGKTQFVFTYGAEGVDYQNNKIYNYVIKETNTGLGGITYADDIPFTVTVKDNLDGTISAVTDITNKNGEVSVVDVTNLYRTNGVTVTLEATKNITGRGLNDGEFKFDLYSLDTNSIVVDDARNDATGKVTFNLPAFDAVGEYRFEVYEDEVDGNGVTVDTTKHNVTVVVNHDGEGNLIAVVNGTDFVGEPINIGVFNNTYKAASADLVLEATKTLTGRGTALEDSEFKFALEDVDDNKIIQDDATNDADGKVVFNTLTFDEVGTYNYVVYENEVDHDGVKVDAKRYNVTIIVTDGTNGELATQVKVDNNTVIGSTANVITFENTYATASVEVVLEATKTLTGRDKELKDKEFKFALKDVDNDTVVQDDATNDVNGKVTFDALTFDKVGTYNYVVYENEVAHKGITVDKTQYDVVITVTDNNEGRLVATVNGIVADTAVNVGTFNNTYKAAGTNITLEATKILVGRDLNDGEFKFDLYDVLENKLLQDDVALVLNADGTGKVEFNSISFDNVGIYKYVIYEDEVNESGITVDKTRYNITVSVIDNDEGRLIAKVLINNNQIFGSTADIIVFRNVYNAASVDVNLEATKTLAGRNTALEDGEFKFVLKDVDNDTVVQENATNDAEGKVAFGTLTFDKVGTYNYVVYENEVDNNGIIVDKTQYDVVITVTDNKEGQLVATVNGTNASGAVNVGTFTNTYKAASVDVNLEATKTLTGRNTALEDGEFKFALKDVDNDTVVQDDATNDANGKVVFDALTFDKAGTYNYVVYENEVDHNGITVDKTQYNVVITVTDNNKGQLLATVNGVDASESINVGAFNNTYKAASTSITLEATKILVGRDLVDGEFKFDLYDVNGDKLLQNDVALVLNADGTGKVVFDSITFENAGIYKYVVYEDEVNEYGITVDTTRYNVTVSVIDDNEGQLNAKVLVNNEEILGSTADIIVFRNVYNAASVDVNLEATKTLTGREEALKDGEFKFALKDVDNDTVVQDDATNDANGKVVFDALTFDKAGTYNYVVYENEVDHNGITVDKTQYNVVITVTDNNKGQLVATVNGVDANGAINVGTFTNTYKANETSVTIEATKVLVGRDLIDGEFKFDLQDADGNVLQNDVTLKLQDNGKGKITFDEITFDKAGTYKYVVYEDEENGNGVTIDTTNYSIEVIVTDDNNGQLNAKILVDNSTVTNSTADTIVFKNVYNAASVDVTLEATKTISGRELVDGEFKFALKDADNDTVVQDDATNDADGKVVFNVLTFDKVGTYNYVVYENEVDGKGVTVDTTKYDVKVVVTDNGKGNLVAEISVGGEIVDGSTVDTITFENSYKADATDIVINAKKTLDGRDLKDGEFEFELWLGDNLLETAKNNADGKVAFKNVAIDAAGEYAFTVKEVKGDDKDITYDETVYTITATVTDNLDGTYKVDYVYAIADEQVEEIVFNNKYTEPTKDPEPTPDPEPQPEPAPEKQPDSPKTSDRINLTGWFAVVFTSGAIIFATGKKLKRLSK